MEAVQETGPEAAQEESDGADLGAQYVAAVGVDAVIVTVMEELGDDDPAERMAVAVEERGNVHLAPSQAELRRGR